MKLINEQNWKQEIARLKAERILLVSKRFNDLLDYYDQEMTLDAYHTISGMLLFVQQRIAKLDKAIETIENVFLHKQCYIEE